MYFLILRDSTGDMFIHTDRQGRVQSYNSQDDAAYYVSRIDASHHATSSGPSCWNNAFKPKLLEVDKMEEIADIGLIDTEDLFRLQFNYAQYFGLKLNDYTLGYMSAWIRNFPTVTCTSPR